MVNNRLAEQTHGYRHGHQLIDATIELPPADQDAVDRLSDLSGPLHPGELFEPYLTFYPLPSRSHYVLARTWQDLDAARAGCVRTYSLFLPWKDLHEADDLAAYVSRLGPGPRRASSPAKLLDRVEDPRCVELVEALFLEPRQPIVMFEASEAETITLRLLSALWPAMRATFAVCTHALGPRSIDGRDFDLVFAPRAARLRFANWTGRTIDAGTNRPPRHRWSPDLAARVFRTAHPSLTEADPLGVFQRDSSGDASALRLALLWRELSEKAATTPFAVLAMLDILKSRPLAERDVAMIAPSLHHAIEMKSGSDDGEIWPYLATLAAKVAAVGAAGVEEFDGLAGIVRNAVIDFVRRDPDGALQSLRADDASEVLPALLTAAVGDGLADLFDRPRIAGAVIGLPSASIALLMKMSPRFLAAAVDIALSDPDRWAPVLITAAQDRESQAVLYHAFAARSREEAERPLRGDGD